jgi:hypothetical protein
MFQVPVLLVIYNRVDETHTLFQTIRQVQPTKLYVAGDGANTKNKLDYVNCLRTRSVINPEWNCETKTLFKEEHLGKSKMIHQAITWFFEHEEEGIILFDDTIPNSDFFHYCEYLLKKYKDTPEVMHISANFLQNKIIGDNKSYFFSAYAFTWGFATWRSTWKGFDLKMSELEDTNVEELIAKNSTRPKEKMYWMRVYNSLKKYNLDYWEYQYNLHIWANNGLSINPNVNLVKNVGLKNQKRIIRRLIKETATILPLREPNEIKRNVEADKYIFKKLHSKAFYRIFFNWFNEVILGMEKKI